MICKDCGREIPEGALFCKYCGARAQSDEAPAGEKKDYNFEKAQKGRRPGLRLEPDILIEAGAARYGEAKGAAAAPGQKQQ